MSIIRVKDKKGNIIDIPAFKGDRGVSISKTEVNSDNELIVTYTDGTVESAGTIHTIGGIDSETDPTVPSWAKEENKPTYTAEEVGAATPDYVDRKVASMVDSAPETLDTLNELAAALGDDPNFATTVATEIGIINNKAEQNASEIETLKLKDGELTTEIEVVSNRLDNIISDGTPTEGNTELIDIRTGYEGHVYTSAGEAVRKQADIALKKVGIDEVLPEHISVFKKSSNLYTGTSTSETGRLNAKGEVDSTQTSFLTSEFIPIGLNNAGKYICCQTNASAGPAFNTSAHSFYDIDKQRISGQSYTINNAIVIPNRAVYFRVSFSPSVVKYYIGINDVAELISSYESYYKPYLPMAVTDYDQEATINTVVSKIIPLKPEDTTFFNKSTNLFNGTSEVGRLIDNGTVDSTKTGYWTSDYIYIAGNDGKYLCAQYKNSLNGLGLKFYDETKTLLPGGNSYSFTIAYEIPAGAVYVRFTQSNNYSTSDCFIGINDTATNMPFEKYYIQIKEEVLPNIPVETPNNWYKGKKASALGDSITANGSSYTTEDGRTGSAWREFVAQELELADTIYNCGVGGSRVAGSTGNAMWEDERIDAIPTDSDIIFFNGGMNDWRSNVSLGTIDSTNTTTFYGALNTIVEKLYARFPTKLIVFMTTTFGVDQVEGNNSPMNGLIVNNSGLTTYDYGRCIKEVAEKNGILCVDLYALCGWNKYNTAVYVNTEGTAENGNTWIHPNREGGKRITTAICSVLKNYQPFEEN